MFLRNWARLYSRQTPSEILMEGEIARLGERYRAQHPFFGLHHIADFALLDRKLIIEVDGPSHDTEAQKRKDLVHTIGLRRLGWFVARCTNDEVKADAFHALHKCLSFTAFPSLEAMERELLKYPAPVARVSRRRGRGPKPPLKTPRGKPRRVVASPGE